MLAALDAFAAQMDDVEGASVFYGVLDAGTGTLTYAAAGHPPPLVVHADGRTSFLPVDAPAAAGQPAGRDAPRSPSTCSSRAPRWCCSPTAPSPAAPRCPTTRWTGWPTSRASVLQAPGALEADAAAGLAAAIAEGVRRPQGWPDDVAVLVAHRRETALEPLQLDLLAVPAALPGVRRRLGAWLTGLGMGEQDRVGVMVAVGEACANAAEHAYRGTRAGPDVGRRADVDVDGVLTVTVRDEGTWRPPDRDPGDRGRGLLIMRQLVDTVVLDERGPGHDGHPQPPAAPHPRRRRRPARRAPRAPSVHVDRDGPRPVVSVTGAVDEVSAEQMRIRLLEASHGGTGRVELDLAGVTLFSSAAVRVVLAIARIARDEGWRLVVHAPEGGVTRHVLEISGLGGLVDLR